MAESDPHDGAGKGRDAEIAAADWLVRDDPAARPAQPAANPALPVGAGEVFDLVEGPGPDPVTPPSVGPIPAAKPRDPSTARAERPSRAEPQVLVEEVWS